MFYVKFIESIKKSSNLTTPNRFTHANCLASINNSLIFNHLKMTNVDE